MSFNVYNTMTRSKEEFIPYVEGKVGMYTCGPTVYNYAHIGNLRTYIFEDVLKKALEYSKFKVKHVMNITDVGHLQSDGDEGQDKMALGAKREHKTVWEIAKFYEDAFFEDCKKLNIKRPTIVCRATEHIQDMIGFIKKLEEKGYTYVSNGNVYFEIDKFPDYAKLAHLSLDELEAGSRIEVDINKRNPLDFVLWFTNSKFSNQIMQWESPWGKGFPGWHLECSTMSVKYIGEYLDIHCGGIDHIAIHHTNEVAQSEGVLGHKWVKYWMHGEFLVLDSGKMSKSSGNFLTISSLEEEGYSPLDYRYFCLQSKYRKQLVFSFESLNDARNGYKKLKERIAIVLSAINENDIVSGEKILSYKEKFSSFISDDLNIANAFTVLFDVLKDTNLNNKEKSILIEDFDKIFTLNLMIIEKETTDIDEELINNLIIERNAARASKNWARADEIRDEFIAMNIELLDSKEGTTWKAK
ncbi:cysteine--tRNA ligase [Clostridium estertheticum]|uniref:Cysteine--tRNA ligase n=1 Tax=Clostridium estertheticum subsp. estertheticum TaxID=1552 RepID=A0A1J0GE26_9CLOT|nr:cysteine--tRNA ligase [Clostridium estertheticum]APC39539.1 cysteine--tRNA ligase [Clostridium estertheticum subsp. estertheticum]MBU3170744.1 cysteine--tRNA ligase [Clostridium estertheticum]MBU3184625.1 cysteine--tRNA ligase [Clostridium estertheticum]MBZ9614431.1 cysteine--tRNA ligase [Clostridium estertheticum subsp. laramiense]WAG74362.1 cysteine--tRNA ligase [Clostridium estertheticum]